MEQEVAVLKRELGRVARGRGTRYPTELRERVVAWALARRRAGASWREIKRELGQRFDTIRQWCRVAEPKGARALVPVRVVAERAPERRVSVMSPAGFRIESLSLTEAVAVLRELG
jgi:predicted transcriptional regulator